MVVLNGPACGSADLGPDSGSVFGRGGTEHVLDPRRRPRFGQTDIPGARDHLGRHRVCETAVAPLADADVLSQAAILPRRDGGMRRCSLLSA